MKIAAGCKLQDEGVLTYAAMGHLEFALHQCPVRVTFLRSSTGQGNASTD